MIETKEAIENIDEILSVPNLKGVYVGPADMASSYGLGPKFDIEEDPVYSNIKLIAKKCADKKLIAGMNNNIKTSFVVFDGENGHDSFLFNSKEYSNVIEKFIES